jgi:hypothetical protein
MALSLGSIGSFFNRALNFSNPSSATAPGQNAQTGPFNYDGSQFSDEMLGGEHNPLLDSIQQTVQQVQLAQSFGGDPSTTVQQLQAELQEAQAEGLQLPPDLQQSVDQILQQFGLGQDGMTPGAGQDFGGAMPGAGQDLGGGMPGAGQAAGPGAGAPSSSPSAGAPGGGASQPAGDSQPAAGSQSSGNSQSAGDSQPAAGATSDGSGQAAATSDAPAGAGPNTWPMAAQFDQALASEPADFRNPDAWSQGDGAGNCSNVAVIKAATAESGNAIFQNVQKTDQGYSITTQDGRTVKLSQADLAAAEKTADFDGPSSPAKAQAIVATGVIAKNYAAEHPGLTYQQALNATNGVKDPVSNPQGNGRFPEDAAHDLGIPFSKTNNAQTAVQDVKNGNGQQAAVIYNGQHAEAVTGSPQGGAKTDDYGHGVNTNGQISKSGKTSQATNGIEIHSQHKDKPKAA